MSDPRPWTACECGDHAFSNATRGFVCLVDPDDVPLVQDWNWSTLGRKTCMYAQRTTSGEGKTTLKMHRVILGVRFADHINHNGMDNRRKNLRAATPSLNAANKRSPRPLSTGYRGVYPAKDGGFEVMVGGKKNLVRERGFKDPTTAARRRDQIAFDRWGEFAILNFPRTTLTKKEGSR